ncbi:MAG TPA: CoA transferase, partial [Aggregatilineales bacterium]|nr:CoA transferase [Aggregatilineales bacterium]
QIGDETRAWGAPWVGDSKDRISAYFASVNRNKRSITLNLKNPHAQHIAKKLALKSHVVIENFKIGQMEGFGLDYESLSSKNPALVYCSITGFGQTGDFR